jgi:hypothetical protein
MADATPPLAAPVQPDGRLLVYVEVAAVAAMTLGLALLVAGGYVYYRFPNR